MFALLAASAAFLPQGPGTSTAPVVINEFQYDDASTDDYEFVELYNRSGAAVDISGWSVRNPDATGPTYGVGTGTDQNHVIPAGTVLAPGAFYVLGNSSIVPLPVPGVSQVLPANGLENDTEAIELVDATGAVVDSLVYESFGGAFGPHPIEGFGFYGDLAVGNGPSSSIGRKLDGWDDDDNGSDFLCCMVPTPGASNNVPSILPYFEDGSTGSTGTTVPQWTSGWVPPYYVDPTAVDAYNPHVRTPSPGSGGLGFVTWDNSGGGNSVSLRTAPVSDVAVDTWVWAEGPMTPFDPTPYSPTLPPAILNTYNVADGEFWAIGVRGTAAANGNPPDQGGYFASTVMGIGTRRHFVTGLCWAYYRTPTFAQLWLLDCGAGADPAMPANHVALAGPFDVPVAGWVRLRLQVQGNEVMANIGGMVGCNDGTAIYATTSTTGPGGVWIAYREAVLYNVNGTAGWHPPVWDDLSVRAPNSGKTVFGTGSPTSVGIPQLAVDGYLLIGSLGPNAFVYRASNLLPLGHPSRAFCGLALGLTAIPGGFPVGGAPPTATGYLIPATTLVGFSDAAGQTSFPFGLPCVPVFVGTPLTAQLIDLDLSLPFAVPIGLSDAITLVIGS